MTSVTHRIGTVGIAAWIVAGSVSSFAQTQTNEAWEIIRANLNEKSTERRVQAVRVLGLLPGNARAFRAAQTATKDEKPEVRASAAVTLGDLHTKQAIPRLEGLLTDD